uniref:BTB domain-containing protein n=1 Tax=Strigamia maritima TaxID=126957 RepID=T1J070_STRMM
MAANESVQRNHQSLLNNLYNSRENGELGIVVRFQCENGQVYAHKNVLTAGSDNFGAMFSPDHIENQTNSASFPDTSLDVLNIVIKSIYTQKLPNMIFRTTSYVKR